MENNEMSIVQDDRQILIENIKKWILLDDQLKIFNEKLKKIRELKSELTENICKTVDNSNTIKNKIGIKGGELKISKKNDYKPLTFSYIEMCLGNLITDKKQVEYIIQFLKDNREITCSPDIKRIYNNK